MGYGGEIDGGHKDTLRPMRAEGASAVIKWSKDAQDH